MTPRQRLAEHQESIWEHHNTPRPYTRSICLEREISGFLCSFEASVKQWSNDGPMPEIEYVSDVQAFDSGGHQVTSAPMLVKLALHVEEWCKENLDEVIEEIERKERKENE